MAGERFREDIEAIAEAVLETPGETPFALRRAIFVRAATASGDPRTDDEHGTLAEIPEDLVPFVDKIVRHAHKVVERDLAELVDAGYSEDALFEVILSTATGAGMARLHKGLAALEACTR